jgi:phosphoribosylglycinamide formyltransferase-1
VRLAVLVSGSGTNLQALLDAGRQLAPGEIVVVVSNRPGVRSLDRAAAAGVPAVVVDHRQHAGRESFEDALAAALAEHRVEAVVLAGFMRLLTPHFLDRYPDRVINIHPSLLPAFPGIDAQRQAFDYGVKVAGATVHFVDAGLDAGPIILQSAVPVLPDDSVETLRARILEREHELLPRAVALLAAGRVVRDGRHVRVTPAQVPNGRPDEPPAGFPKVTA